MSKKIGVVGLGAMGLGMAGSLRRAGFEVHVCDIRKQAAQDFAKDGGVAHDTPADLAKHVEIIVGVVVNADQTEALLFGDQGAASGMSKGSLYIMCSTVDPNWSIALEKRLNDLGMLYLDSPISGGAAKAASGQMTIMSAGSPAAYEKAGDALSSMAAKFINWVTKRGQAAKLKLSINF